jgi:hypothetical protein
MLGTVIQTAAENFNVLMLASAFAAAVVNARWSKEGFAEQLFRWTMLLSVGFTGLFTFVVHVFAPERSAANIGWKVSPFQYEVGIADMTIGVLGVLAFRRNEGFRWAATIAATCWLLGCTVGHIEQIVIAKNFAPGNAGVWLWTSPINSVILIATLLMSRRGRNGVDPPLVG